MASSSHQARMGRGTTRGGGERKWDGGDKDDDGGSSGNCQSGHGYQLQMFFNKRGKIQCFFWEDGHFLMMASFI